VTIVFIIAAMMAIDALTFGIVWNLPPPRPWRILAIGLFTIGIAVGVWLACFFTYQSGPNRRTVGFPIPAAIFQLENGVWVDYISPFVIVIPFNVLIIATCFLLPVSLGLAVRRLVIGLLPTKERTSRDMGK
jgi:hypothetical protein